MRLNDFYSIKLSGRGINLIKKINVVDKETGELKEGEILKFYGTVYQSLQGFLNESLKDSLENENVDLINETKKIMMEIEEAEKRIRKIFCCEVKNWRSI